MILRREYAEGSFFCGKGEDINVQLPLTVNSAPFLSVQFKRKKTLAYVMKMC